MGNSEGSWHWIGRRRKLSPAVQVPVNLVSMVVTGAHESGTVLLLDDEAVGESVPGETTISRLIDDCCG
ncbi:hypothetical protein [Brevibacterium sp. FAM 24638]|uniref:hypothetical protein n=1 Tax=unclassified Brevibacterium TaxID=2614124 RepID=UPI003C7A94BC